MDVEETVLWPETLLPDGNDVGYVGGETIEEEAKVSIPVSGVGKDGDEDVETKIAFSPEARADGDVGEGLALVVIEDFGVSEAAELSEVDWRAATTMSLALTWPTWKVVG